jgi:hypothetical protein
VHVTLAWDTRTGASGPQTLTAMVTTDATGASGTTTLSVAVAD